MIKFIKTPTIFLTIKDVLIMNVLSAMAGINDGEFCKKFTKQGVDIITLGGFNMDVPTFKAGLENISKYDRKEFFTCPHHISEI